MYSSKRKILPEVLLCNRLDNNVQRWVYPFNLFLMLLLSPKFNVRDNFVTPVRVKTNAVLFGLVAFMYVFRLYRLFVTELEDPIGVAENTINIAFFGFYFVAYCTGFAMLLIMNICRSDSNISLILTIQHIYRSLNFGDEINSVIYFTWILILIVFVFNIVFYLIYYTMFNCFDFFDCSLDYLFIAFDINLIYVISITFLLRKFIEFWNKTVSGLNIEEISNRAIDELFCVYRCVIAAYNLLKELFHVMIFFHVAEVFFRSLCYVAIILQIMKKHALQGTDVAVEAIVLSFFGVAFLMKDILLIILQCMEGEKFYIVIEEAETVCIQRLKNRHYSDFEEDLYTNVVQLNRSSFSKIGSTGLFNIDGALPLHLLGLLTNYVILLLQVIFLEE